MLINNKSDEAIKSEWLEFIELYEKFAKLNADSKSFVLGVICAFGAVMPNENKKEK